MEFHSGFHSGFQSERTTHSLLPKKTKVSAGLSYQPNHKSYQGNSQATLYRTSTGNWFDRGERAVIGATLLPADRNSIRVLHRASTGALPQHTKAGCRVSTGGLRLASGPGKTNSYHHILAGDLKTTSPTNLQPKPEQKVERTTLCGRCDERIKKQYFKCLNCRNFNLCAECGDGGIYCQDDTHSWVEKSAHRSELKSHVIGKISSGEARTLYYGTRTFPSIFRPPSPLDLPETLFTSEHRFIRNRNPREILIYADGVCLQNLKAGPVAGWAFVYRPSAYTQDGKLTHAGTISGRLEAKGPTGKMHKMTSNRAQLRATIAALQFLDWSRDCNRGWRSVVIATDSEYVTCSITKWIPDWEDSKWKLGDNTDVNNKDLWELLLLEVRRYHSEGVKIAFWRVPRHCNTRAHEYAKKATGRGYKERVETMIFQPDGPVKVRVSPFITQEVESNYSVTR